MSDLRNFNNFTMLKMFNLDEKNIQDFKVYDVPEVDDNGKVIRYILNIDIKLVDLRPRCSQCDVERHFNPSMKIFLFHQPLN